MDGEHGRFEPGTRSPRPPGHARPRHASQKGDAALPLDTSTGVAGETQGEENAELPEILPAQPLGRLWASSMGLSCRVAADTDVLVVTARWGEYTREKTEDEEGRSRTIWARVPRDFTKEIRLDGAPDQRIGLTAVTGQLLRLPVRLGPPPRGNRTVEIFLVNNQREPDTALETAWLFQTELTVTALDGDSPVFLPIDDPLTEDAPTWTTPKNCTCGFSTAISSNTPQDATSPHAETVPELRRARLLRTTWLPSYDVPATVALADQGTPLAARCCPWTLSLKPTPTRCAPD